MAENAPLWPHVARKTPEGGAHIHLGERNFFFVTVNTKDRVPWMAQAAVQETLVRIWRWPVESPCTRSPSIWCMCSFCRSRPRWISAPQGKHLSGVP